MNTIYIIIVGDGWNWVMFENILPFGAGWVIYSVFFVVMSVFGNKVMLSLFTAILLENFEAKVNEEEESEDDVNLSNSVKESSLCKRLCDASTYDALWMNFKDFFGYRPTRREL